MIDLLNHWDERFFLMINSWHHPIFDQLMPVVSGTKIWYFFIALTLYFIVKKIDRKNFFLYFTFFILTIACSDAMASGIFKNLFERLRPCHLLEIKKHIHLFGQKCGGKYGFVSSHAANSFAFSLFIIRTLKLNSFLKFLFIFFTLAVSYSRIYLGVHFPGDILGGLLIGGGWSLFFSHIFNNLYGARRKISQPVSHFL